MHTIPESNLKHDIDELTAKISRHRPKNKRKAEYENTGLEQ